MRSAVVAKLGQLTSSAWDRVIRRPVLQPRSRPTDPLEKLQTNKRTPCFIKSNQIKYSFIKALNLEQT